MGRTTTLAAIDIGSNTIQLMIANVCNGKISSRSNDIRTTRLGACAKDGRISAAAITASVDAIKKFCDLAEAEGVEKIRFFATSAVRDAANKEELLEAIGQVNCQRVEILSGEEEAMLSYKGARNLLDFPLGTPVLDVGGSSSELIYELADGVIEGKSVNVGAVRMKQNSWDMQEIHRLFSSSFSPRSTADLAIGIGGTITTVAGVIAGNLKFDRSSIHGVILTRGQLENLLQKLLPLTPEERCAFSPLLNKRGEIIEQGLAIWLTLMDLLNLKKILVCGGGILDGAIADMI